MRTLFERFVRNQGERLAFEEYIDAIYCLCNALEGNGLRYGTPENIVINEDGTVSVDSLAKLSFMDLYFQSPEIILEERKRYCKADGLFTLGLLAYFITKGRYFYEHNGKKVVQMREMRGRDESLITEEAIYKDRNVIEDCPPLALVDAAIMKFTSWDPSKREEGIRLLLDAVQMCDSSAEISYVCNGQEVFAETITVEVPHTQIAKGKVIRGTDGKNYTVSELQKLPFRPGTHPYTVAVETGESVASGLEYYLVVKSSTQTKYAKLMKLEQQPLIRKIEVDRGISRRYDFSVVKGDPIRQIPYASGAKTSVGVPAGRPEEKSLLQVRYNPADRVVEFALYNREGTKLISDNVIKLQVED